MKKQIVEKFVDLELEEKGYNNQNFYEASEQRLRYVLVTMDMAPSCLNKEQYDLFKTDNKFYNCIEFYKKGQDYVVNNPELLKELMDMDYDALYNYVTDNEYEWIGDDFIHINEYLDFVSDMQDVFYFQEGDICNDDEYMEIYKFRWIRDSVKGYKSANKYEIAYKILLENALITNETKERLNAIEVDSCS